MTDPLASSGISITRRKVVLREVSIPKRSANRTPPLPQVARPRDVICSLSLIVIRAHGSASVLRRSVNTFREQSGLWQKNLRTAHEKAEADVLRKERLSRFDGSDYGCQTKAVNRVDNRTEDRLRSLKPRVPSPLFGSGQFPFLLRGPEVLLLSSHPSLTAFPILTRSLHTKESIMACQVHH